MGCTQSHFKTKGYVIIYAGIVQCIQNRVMRLLQSLSYALHQNIKIARVFSEVL